MKTITAILIASTVVGASVAEACTSWAIRPEVSESGLMIVQKTLDERYRDRLDADIRVAPNGWRWIRVGSFKFGASMSMNEKGVVVTSNCGDITDIQTPFWDRDPMGNYELQRAVMKNCSAAADGVELLKNILRNRRFRARPNTGYVLLVADAHRAFMIEIGDGYAEAAEVTGGMHVVVNSWMLPGGEELSVRELPGLRVNRAREACAVKLLQERRVNGKYTLRGCFDTSRAIRGRATNQKNPFVHGVRDPKNMSLETACFEIDPEFPEYLSCTYLALGPQRHMVYLPVPMAVRQLPDKMRDGRWAEMAYSHQEAFGPEHTDLEKISDLEDKFLAEFKAVRAEARKLLREGKKAEAAKLLNDCFDRQYAEADKLMTALYAAAKEKLKTSKTEPRKE